MTGSRQPATAAVLCLLGLGACASAGRDAAAVPFDRTVALPAAVAAALASDALRHALPFGDPLPEARGAPVQPLPDGGFAIAWAADGDGGLRPLGSHRLELLPPPAAAGTTALRLAAGCGGPAAVPPALRLHVAPAGAVAARLSGELPAATAPALAAALDHALDLGTGRTAAGPGLATPNQHAWQAHRVLGELRAAAADDPAREPLLQRLLQFGAPSPALHADLGELAARAGRAPAATSHWWLAALGSDDPLRRQQCAAQAFAAAAGDGDAAAARRTAAARAAAGDGAAALALLHTAGRLAGPDRAAQAAGYAAAAAVAGRAQPPLAGLARALLAREHGAPAAAAGVATALAAAGLGELAARVHGAAAAPALAAPAR